MENNNNNVPYVAAVSLDFFKLRFIAGLLFEYASDVYENGIDKSEVMPEIVWAFENLNKLMHGLPIDESLEEAFEIM